MGYYVHVTNQFTHWGTPNTIACHNATVESTQVWEVSVGIAPPTSNHPGGVNMAMADGSVRFIKDSVGLQTWWRWALATVVRRSAAIRIEALSFAAQSSSHRPGWPVSDGCCTTIYRGYVLTFEHAFESLSQRKWVGALRGAFLSGGSHSRGTGLMILHSVVVVRLFPLSRKGLGPVSSR